MSSCLLCLQVQYEIDNYIPLNSQKWLQLEIIGTVEKHFWPIVDMDNILGICQICWSKVNGFHEFYAAIVEAHRRNVKISTKNQQTVSNLEIPSDDCKLEIFEDEISIQESNFTSGYDIKNEPDFSHDETCVPATMMNVVDMDYNPISLAKRKRGRPRKKKAEMVVKKPKGKRGRPRKVILELSKIAKQHTILSEASNTHDHKNITSCPPKVKRSRGRPRKIQKIEATSNQILVHEVQIPDINKKELIGKSCPTVQTESVINGAVVNSSEPVKLVQTKKKFHSLLKKRKRIQQHKTLMRNYIATSIHCMKFFKK